MKHASYVAVIRRVADGETRRRQVNFEWDTEAESEGDWFNWAEGNYSCDCNRYLEFERAGGERPRVGSTASLCGDSAYQVIRFEFPDGSAIDGPDA
jgi:hypothetical protein